MKLLNKRLISFLLALAMICGMIPMTAFAAEEGETDLWSGRSAVFVGDSITVGSGTTKIYYEYLGENLDFDTVTPMGIAGSCISAASDYGQSNQPLINRYQNIPSADLIVVFMGTNDYGHETPLGSVDDTQDGTFYGALNVIIPALVAKHPSSKIAFVTPLHRYGFGTSKMLGTQFTYDNIPNGVGATLGDYVGALKTVCANNGVFVIDLYTECTLDPADAVTRMNYMPDGLHPNAAGHEAIAGIMESHIRSFEPTEQEPIELTEMVYGNRFATGNNQTCRASSRINYYLKAGTVITLRDSAAMQWACTKTSDETSSGNLGYFPDSGWSDKATAVVTEDGWVGFTFKYRDETQSFDLTKPLSDYITVEEPHTHTYENGICTGCGATVTPYLQQLPENITGCTNLYDCLLPVKGYYTAAKYDTSNGDVLSVVIPVEPGDRIAASSFGPVSENMGSANGIRVTYLLGDKIVTSLSAGEVYNGYTNNGYITVPDGVDAVCVPWWKPSESNWLTLGQISKNFASHSPKAVSAQAPTCTENGYTAGEICEICSVSLGEREEIPATGHSYSGDTCTVCGTVNLLAFLDGKYVSVLGDSISTFNGYSNDAAVNSTIGGNGPRYDAGTADTKPGSYCLLESVDQTWWMHFANRSGMKLLVNNSWAGSQVFGGKTSDGRVIPAAYLDRCVNLHDNTLENNPGNAPINPDVIFVYLGINDYNFNRGMVGTGTVDYSSLVGDDGTYATPATFGEAYGIMLHKMRSAYPNAQIFAMTLLPENLYSVDKAVWEQHNAYIRAAAEFCGIPVVDLAENCAITWENYSDYMIDRIHPTTAGMKLISDCIEAELVAYYKENPPHTHNYTPSVTTPAEREPGYTIYTCGCGDSYRTPWLDKTAYEGMTIACVGDSITAAYGVTKDENDYVKLLAEQLGMEYIRLGVSGTTLCADGSRTCNIGKLTETCLQGADIVTIAMGINDFCAAGAGYYALGDINSTDSSTIYGAARMWCERIAELRNTESLKDTQFYFVTPVICSWNNSVTSGRDWDQSKTNIHGYTLRDLCNAIIEVAELYDVAVIDLNLLSGMYYVSAEDNNTAIFGGDGVHPGANGHAMMANAMANALLQNDLRDDHAHSFGSWITTTYPDCLNGEQHRVCTICTATEIKILDGNGHTYENGICLGCGTAQPGPVITQQPVNGEAKLGERYMVEVKAEGEGLKYQWYLRNAGSKRFSKSSVKDNTYDDVMTTTRAGREVYCVITDVNGNSVTTDTVKLICLPAEELAITKQPTDGEAVLGERYCVTVEAKGEGLKYQWYFRNKGATNWSKSSVTDNTYDDIMNNTRAGREVYCVITDRFGNKVTTDTVKLVRVPVKLEIISQPVDANAAFGELFCATVVAKGEGLKYQWYYRNAGSDTWRKSGVRDNTYDDIMTKARNGREIYCVITDKYGNCVTTDIAKLIAVPKVELKLLEVSYECAAMGERFCVTVNAQGEGLKYQWYFRNAGAARWSKSGVTDNTYDDVMNRTRADREVYCVITDACGNRIITEAITLTVKK